MEKRWLVMFLRRCFTAVAQRIVVYSMNRKKPCGKVLTFHQICDDRSEWEEENCAISKQAFEEMIEELIKSGAEFEEMEKIFCMEESSQRIWLTFDDAYEDVYKNAFPVLQKYKIPFTLFLTVDFLDRDNYLKIESIRHMLQSKLCSIGAHTISHRMLSSLPADEACFEIIESKKKLEEIFNVPVNAFAFPFGSMYACKKEHQKPVRNAGFQLAFSTLDSALPKGANIYFLPRINVNEYNYKNITRR